MLKRGLLLVILLISVCTAGDFEKGSGIILTDHTGKTYDVDAILTSGKHIVVHQTGST